MRDPVFATRIDLASPNASVSVVRALNIMVGYRSGSARRPARGRRSASYTRPQKWGVRQCGPGCVGCVFCS